MTIRVNMDVKGKEYAPFVVTVERGKIKEFGRAIGDLSPFYLDDTIGRASEWGDIIAPSTFPTTFRDENADTGAEGPRSASRPWCGWQRDHLPRQGAREAPGRDGRRP
jgi:hypothetical protein